MDSEELPHWISTELVRVFDMESSSTPDEAAEVLKEHYAAGFYIAGVVPWPTGARVFLRRYAKASPNEPKVVPTKEAVAMQFLRDHREMSSPQLVAALIALGFPRSAKWINEKRDAIIRADRRVT